MQTLTVKVGDARLTYFRGIATVETAEPVKPANVRRIANRTHMLTVLAPTNGGKARYQARIGSLSAALLFARALYECSVFPNLRWSVDPVPF